MLFNSQASIYTRIHGLYVIYYTQYMLWNEALFHRLFVRPFTVQTAVCMAEVSHTIGDQNVSSDSCNVTPWDKQNPAQWDLQVTSSAKTTRFITFQSRLRRYCTPQNYSVLLKKKTTTRRYRPGAKALKEIHRYRSPLSFWFGICLSSD